MRILSTAFLSTLLLLASTNSVFASAMMEPQRITTTVDFDNGDRLILKCPMEAESCQLELLVNRKQFSFGRDEIGAVILPYEFSLYSGPFSGRDEYFSFEVQVECPGDEDSVCTANVLVETGRPLVVNVWGSKQ